MRQLTTVIFFFFITAGLFGQTNVSGSYDGDSTWTAANSPYVVDGFLHVLAGGSLTIESGVEVRFNSAIELRITGELFADGVTFTSNQGTKARGDWYGLRFYNNVDTSFVSNSTIEYATYGFHVYGLVSADNVTFSSNTQGVNMYYNDAILLAKLRNSSFVGNGWPVVAYYPGMNLDMDQSTSISGNDADVIYVENYNNKTTFGDRKAHFPLVNVPYYIKEQLTISSGDTLDIASGNIVKVQQSVYIIVNGYLLADAGTGENIWFTAWTDDVLGGDSNGDGSSTSPASQYWGGIHFDPGSGGILRRSIVSYAGYYYYKYGAVDVDNASPVIDQSEFYSNYYGLSMRRAAAPVLTDNIFGSSQVVPIAMSFEASPVFTDNAFSSSDNQYDAIGLFGGTLTANANIVQRDFTAIPNVTYLVLGDVVIPEGLTLNIEPGVVLKYLNGGHEIKVYGALTAIGTSGEHIVFTSVKDDNYGNPQDTNKDGTNSVPLYNDWNGIFIYASSGTLSRLEYCDLNYGYYSNGYTYNGGTIYPYGMVNMDAASPQILNCEFKSQLLNAYNVSGIAVMNDATPVIQNNSFSEIIRTPIAIMPSAFPVFGGNTFNNVGIAALGIIGHNMPIDGTLNKRDVAGYTNITYALLGNLIIQNGARLDVDAGVVVKSLSGTGFYVDGVFSSVGTSGENVIFTSIKDDNYGNPIDTNGDGNDTAPVRGDWLTILFRATSDDDNCEIDQTKILFGGGHRYYVNITDEYGAIGTQNASPSVTNTLISGAKTFGINCEGSSAPLIQNVTIENSVYPLGISFFANPTYENITFTGNETHGLALNDRTLGSEASLSPRSIAQFSNIAYMQVSDLTINSGATLTMNPGTVYKFWSNYLYNRGALKSLGTAGEKVVFTSRYDDSYSGDTNADGNTVAPGPGNWSGIRLYGSANDSLNLFQHTIYRYASYGPWYEESSGEIDQSTIELIYYWGLGSFGSADPYIHDSEFTNIRTYPVHLSMFSNPTFTNNSAFNIGNMAFWVKDETFSLPAIIPQRDFAGYSNISYVLGTLTINTGTTIGISAGTVFKSGGFVVNGSLDVMGTAEDPVIFTDFEDDDYGNPSDTQSNGTASTPSRSGYRLRFNDVSNDTLNKVDHAIIRWADKGIYLDQAAPRITNTWLGNSNYGIELTGVSEPVVTNNIFEDLIYTPLLMSVLSFPASHSGNSIIGTTYNALGIRSETLTQDYTLQKQNFGGVTNIPYYFTGTYTIGTSAVLTISPGVVMKFRNGAYYLHVRRGLIADGGSGPDSTIVFTHIYDDYYGGDSNSDGDATVPNAWSAKRWNGIVFSNEALDPYCKIDNVVFAHAGYSAGEAAVEFNSNSFSITNSVFTDMGRDAIEIKGASDPQINFNDFVHVRYFGVNSVSNFTVNAENNWWGDDSGPTHSGNPGGTGIAVTDGVDYMPFVSTGSLQPLAGDVSLNGSVQAYDASLTLQHVATTITLSTKQQAAADVSGEGGITAYDASLILQYVVGKIGFFPVEAGSKTDLNPKLADLTSEYLKDQMSPSGLVRLGTGQAINGEQISIPLALEQLDGVTSVQLRIKYDPDKLAYESVDHSGWIGNNMFIENVNTENGELILAVAGADYLENSDEALNLNFSVPEKVKGNHSAAIEVIEFLANENDLSLNAVDGSVSIEGLPTEFILQQNYPNPFNGATQIEFKIPDNSRVSIEVFDIMGRKIKTLVDKAYEAGSYKVTWDGTNNAFQPVSSGIYFYRIQSGSFNATKKLHFLK